MIIYYTNKEISKKLNINLARWKRWSRSFLPPDPLGGMQSGYARQYLFKDIFKIFLGGHLLSHLKLGVPESQHVLADLSPWLKKNGFLSLNGDHGAGTEKSDQSGGYRIYFRHMSAAKSKNRSGFSYLIRKTISTESYTLLKEMQTKEIYIETYINHTLSNGSVFLKDPCVRLINLSALFGVLVDSLAGMSAH
jgi:hypothetical protein